MDSIGVCLSLFSSFISTCGCLGTEVAFKNGRRRFLVRLAQMRSGAVLVSTIFFFAHVRHYDLWHQSFFHGWTWKVVVLVGKCLAPDLSLIIMSVLIIQLHSC